MSTRDDIRRALVIDADSTMRDRTIDITMIGCRSETGDADASPTEDGRLGEDRRMGFTRAELESFRDQEVDDLIGPDLRLLFVGINTGLWTAAVQTHLAHPW